MAVAIIYEMLLRLNCRLSTLLTVFGVRVSVMFHLMCFHIISVRFEILSGNLFGKELLTRLTICSLCILTICYFSHFPLWL